MNALFEGSAGERLRKFIVAGVILLVVFLGIQVVAGLMGLRYIGAGIAAGNTINVSGYGEAVAVPDIATFSFSVMSEKPTVAAAQADATAKANATTEYLKSAGIEEKDIQTSDYSVSPMYDYVQKACAQGYCPGGEQVLRGYQVRQTTTVKVRDTEKAGELLGGVGSAGATEVSGLNFTFDDPNQVQDEARQKAIADAKAKADELARQLGVSIVRVVSFSESGSGYPVPMAYGRGAEVMSQAMDAKSAPDISVGQNKVTSNVSVTYEIR
ncbi:MAG: hypothetical protein JWL87_559 [Candidatus Adlerbacteria bacterium]|nr:hypothetical protein [Candidatus Adlerbacteria bacterium]